MKKYISIICTLIFNLVFSASSSDSMPEVILKNLAANIVAVDENNNFRINDFAFELDSESKMKLITSKSREVVLPSIDLSEGRIAWARISRAEIDISEGPVVELQVEFAQTLSHVDENNSIFTFLERELDKINPTGILERVNIEDLNQEAIQNYFRFSTILSSVDLLFKFKNKEIASELFDRLSKAREDLNNAEKYLFSLKEGSRYGLFPNISVCLDKIISKLVWDKFFGSTIVKDSENNDLQVEVVGYRVEPMDISLEMNFKNQQNDFSVSVFPLRIRDLAKGGEVKFGYKKDIFSFAFEKNKNIMTIANSDEVS